MSAAPTNPLIDDRDVELILDEVLDLGRLLRLPYFADHDLHLGRRSRSHRQHRPHDARPDPRRARRHEGRVAVLRPQAPDRSHGGRCPRPAGGAVGVPTPRLATLEGGALVDNDVAVTGLIHKIGWRGLPSLALAYGERGDCRGWLVGEPHQGIRYMFQMMNEARIMVGLNSVATALVAYHEAVGYARTRTQGRPVSAKDPAAPQVAIARHPDVRRMLLRQKAIAIGGLVLIARVSYYADLAEHAPDPAERERAGRLLDVLTPVAKSFPAERGFEANALAIQVHGGYGYSSEYLPEAWLRDQKLNSIHEGTTGIQALDLLGRRAVARGGAGLAALGAEIAATCARARTAGVEATWIAAVERAVSVIAGLTAELAGRGLAGSAEAMVLHATDYLDLFATAVIAWQWLDLAAIAQQALAGPLPRGRASRDAGYYRAKLAAAQYWIRTELPRIDHLAALCRDGEDSYLHLDPDWL